MNIELKNQLLPIIEKLADLYQYKYLLENGGQFSNPFVKEEIAKKQATFDDLKGQLKQIVDDYFNTKYGLDNVTKIMMILKLLCEKQDVFKTSSGEDISRFFLNVDSVLMRCLFPFPNEDFRYSNDFLLSFFIDCDEIDVNDIKAGDVVMNDGKLFLCKHASGCYLTVEEYADYAPDKEFNITKTKPVIKKRKTKYYKWYKCDVYHKFDQYGLLKLEMCFYNV